MDSSSPPPSLGATSCPRSTRLAPDQHGTHAASAPQDVETRARCPAASVLPARPRHRTLRPPYTVESIFRNFTIRRAALIRALTTDEEAFFNKCDPGMQLLCLRGNTDGSWEVKPPESCVPISQPEPTLGINISRDKMKRHEWLQEVAVQCDAWLINISFYFAPLLIASERERLFNMMNSLKTVQETFLASNTYLRICHLEEEKKGPSCPAEGNEEELEATSEDKNFCASCGDRYHANTFWICCNTCNCWYHGKCVKMTASKAKHIEHYECPECCSEKVGHDYDADPMLSNLYKRY